MPRALLTLLAASLALAVPATAQLDHLLAPVGGSTQVAALSRAGVPAAVATHEAATSSPAPGGLSLTAEALLAELEKQLGDHFSTDGELKLALLRGWTPLALPAQDWAVAVTEWPQGGISSTFFLRAKIFSGGETVADIQLPLKAQLLQEVWLAANRLDKGQTLDRSLLATQKVDVIRERGALLPASTDPGKLEVAMTIPAGRALTKRDVVAKPVVRKGQAVEATGTVGLLHVRMKAVALENGATGDVIKLRNLETRKDFNAQVLDENKVQVHF
jgi:flagella basal body P-ring formation protein FlgA